MDADERTLITIQCASNGLPINVIKKYGLYSLILTSRKPEAKRFKKWVTSVPDIQACTRPKNRATFIVPFLALSLLLLMVKLFPKG